MNQGAVLPPQAAAEEPQQLLLPEPTLTLTLAWSLPGSTPALPGLAISIALA